MLPKKKLVYIQFQLKLMCCKYEYERILFFLVRPFSLHLCTLMWVFIKLVCGKTGETNKVCKHSCFSMRLHIGGRKRKNIEEIFQNNRIFFAKDFLT